MYRPTGGQVLGAGTVRQEIPERKHVLAAPNIDADPLRQERQDAFETRPGSQRTVLGLRLPSGPASFLFFLPRTDASDRFQLGVLCPRASIFATFFLPERIL